MQRYNYSYSGGEASFFVSEQGGGYFIGSLLYCKKSGSWTEGKEIILNFDVQQFCADSTDDAIEKAETWFKNNISKDFIRE